jgi:hypothetical protein
LSLLHCGRIMASRANTRQELSSFRPASCRPGMPDRSDPMRKGLRTSGLHGSGQEGDAGGGN